MALNFQIFKQFLILGCISFGGPVAHIGYFKKRFVDEMNWLSDEQFSRLLALCQCLPGPASSQLGFAIGYHKGGLIGAVLAFVGFTAPSFCLMFFAAILSSWWLDTQWLQALIHGLKLLAVIVVADAIVGMSKTYCTNLITRFMAVFSLVVLMFFPNTIAQIVVLVIAAVIGISTVELKRISKSKEKQSLSLAFNKRWLMMFALIFVVLSWSSYYPPNIQLIKEFYIAGSLVFGGGHVVLPLLQNGLADIINIQIFLSGYGFAQLVPGPMFTISSFLGAAAWQGSAFIGAVLSTIAIFLPGFLLLLAVLPAWETLCLKPRFNAAIAMISASVVGLLAAAWVSPIVTSSVTSIFDVFVVLLGGYLLRWQQLSILKISLLILLFVMTNFILYHL